MVYAVWLAPAGADLDIMREASLEGESVGARWCLDTKKSHPHGGVQSPGNFVVLLETRAASEDLWQPELANSAFHVANFALSWGRSLDPLRRFPSDTTHHVGMGQCLWRPLLGLDIEGRGNRLGDPRVQRRSPARDDQVAVDLVARAGAAIAVSSPGTNEGSVRAK